MVFAEAITNSAHLTRPSARRAGPPRCACAAAASARACPAPWAPSWRSPDRKVVGVCSDGAAMYSITALWTAAHHRIPVTYVMLNNAAYRILKLNMVEYLGTAARGRQFVGDGPHRSRAALRPHGRIDGRTGPPRGQARRPRPGAARRRSPTTAPRWSTSSWRARSRSRDPLPRDRLPRRCRVGETGQH